jgi:hypothetical protein
MHCLQAIEFGLDIEGVARGMLPLPKKENGNRTGSEISEAEISVIGHRALTSQARIQRYKQLYAGE